MVERGKLKHNFLKRIYFRVDYVGLLDQDVEQIVSNLRDFIYKDGFNNLKDFYDNQVNFEFNVDISSNCVNTAHNSPERIHTYEFYNENNESLLLSKNYFSLNVMVNEAEYSFDKYISILVRLITNYNKISKYSKPIRIGLQKTNVCYLSDLMRIQDYFSNVAFNVLDLLQKNDGYSCRNCNLSTELRKNSTNILYNRNIQEGQMNASDGDPFTSYQVILDCIVYNENTYEIQEFSDEDGECEKFVRKLNELEFEVYIKSLTDGFIYKLTETEFIDNNIEGVV